MARKRRLKGQLPDISSSLALIGKLRAKRDAEEDTNTQFLLSDSVYANATIPPTDKVSKSVVLSLIIYQKKYFVKLTIYSVICFHEILQLLRPQCGKSGYFTIKIFAQKLGKIS